MQDKATAEKHIQSPEMTEFNEALRSVMQVSKEDLKKLLAKEKAANADKPKRGPKKSLVLESGPK
jgi:hypothetical protein